MTTIVKPTYLYGNLEYVRSYRSFNIMKDPATGGFEIYSAMYGSKAHHSQFNTAWSCVCWIDDYLQP